jgi:muramidase (phage lysozyme)
MVVFGANDVMATAGGRYDVVSESYTNASFKVHQIDIWF